MISISDTRSHFHYCLGMLCGRQESSFKLITVHVEPIPRQSSRMYKFSLATLKWFHLIYALRCHGRYTSGSSPQELQLMSLWSRSTNKHKFTNMKISTTDVCHVILAFNLLSSYDIEIRGCVSMRFFHWFSVISSTDVAFKNVSLQGKFCTARSTELLYEIAFTRRSPRSRFFQNLCLVTLSLLSELRNRRNFDAVQVRSLQSNNCCSSNHAFLVCCTSSRIICCH